VEPLTRSVPVHAALIAVLLLGGVSLLADTASKEYQVKAVFLFNFANFVDWPAKSFPAAATPFVIGILGDNPFGTYLDDVVRGEKIANHPVELRRYDREDEIAADSYALNLLERVVGRESGCRATKAILDRLRRERSTRLFSAWLSTHPSPGDRLKVVDELCPA